MNTPTIVRCTSPADLLAALPRMLGFEPCAGVYLIPFRDKHFDGEHDLDGTTDTPTPNALTHTPHTHRPRKATMTTSNTALTR